MGSNNFLEALGDLYSNVRHRVVGQFEYIVEHMFAEDFYFDAISLELTVWESKRGKNKTLAIRLLQLEATAKSLPFFQPLSHTSDGDASCCRRQSAY